MRTEYSKYFDALSKHPRLLVGTTVPSFTSEGLETLRDSNDAREWQEAAKQVLLAEVRDRASRLGEEDREMMSVLHGSIELFQNNSDLVPGTREFDRELADEFAQLVKPYEVRVDGKMHGYSVPVQPLVEQIRRQLVARRAAAEAAAPAPAAQAAQAAASRTQGAPPALAAPPPAQGPQGGIPSKAGAASEEEDFSVLFGTIGLPALRI